MSVPYTFTSGTLIISSQVNSNFSYLDNKVGSVSQGGTGATSLTAGYLVKGNGTSAVTASVVYDDGTNVGIGTSSPGSKLAVGGNPPQAGAIAGVAASGGISLALSDNVNNSLYVKHPAGAGPMLGTDAGGQLVFATNGFTEAMRINGSGNVGIGTSSPNAKLHVEGGSVRTSGSYIVSGAGELKTSLAGSGIAINTASANGIAFETGGTPAEQMRITNNGDVGIGNVPSGAKLDVSGLIRSRTSTAYVDFNHDGVNGALSSTSSLLAYAGGANSMILHTNGAERMRIGSAGNVGIGTSSPDASALLDVQSTTKGFRLPNMTTTQKNAISSPAAGLMVFDTTLSKACLYTGSAWQTITSA